MRASFAAACVVLAVSALAACVAASASSESGTVWLSVPGGERVELSTNVVAAGFTWAENLTFLRVGDTGVMIVTECVRGEVYVITPNGDGNFTTTQFLSGFGRILGLAPAVNGTVVYAAARLAANSTDVIVAFDAASSATAGTYEVVATLPSGFLPNGLGLDHTSGVLYASSEGNFLPGGGRIFAVHPQSGAVINLKSDGLWSADGLWIDQTRRILYVGQLLPGSVWAYDLAGAAPIGMLHGGNSLLDDFTLTADGNTLVGAQWLASTITAFSPALGNSTVSVLFGGDVHHPTSVRFGSGAPGFPATSLFITEGDGVFAFQTNCRVLELPNAAQQIADALLAAPRDDAADDVTVLLPADQPVEDQPWTHYQRVMSAE